MQNNEIEQFLKKQSKDAVAVKISFKKRNNISGVFVEGNDYAYLKAKNFWRIVTGENIAAWKQSGDNNLAKIFNGAEFSRLSAE